MVVYILVYNIKYIKINQPRQQKNLYPHSYKQYTYQYTTYHKQTQTQKQNINEIKIKNQKIKSQQQQATRKKEALMNKNKNFNRIRNIDPEQEQDILEGEMELHQSTSHNYKDRIVQILYEWKYIILIVVVGFVLWYASTGQTAYQVVYVTNTYTYFLKQSINNLEHSIPKKYIDIEQIQHHPQLPFCMIVDNSDQKLSQQITQSIMGQQYENYKIVYFDFGNGQSSQLQLQQLAKKSKQYESNSYYQLLNRIKQNCIEKSVVSFATEPLSLYSLQKQNGYLQEYNAWLLYDLVETNTQKVVTQRTKVTQSTLGVRVVAVYNRIFQLIDRNDFYSTNKQMLKKQFDPAVIMTALFQLCRYFTLPVNSQQLYKPSQKLYTFMSYNFNTSNKQQPHRRTSYQNMHSLIQNFQRKNIKHFDRRRSQFFSSTKTLTQKVLFHYENQLTHREMQRVLQFEQIIYLPDNHSLALLQIKRMEENYSTGNYTKQLPLCIDINSNNNVQNQRYKKVFQSVLSQNYSNFQVVFTDDLSTDQTLNLTKKYLQQEMKFPSNRINFIRTLKKKYATYNILNAAFNYCKKDSILVLVDGDDQLIGKQVFKFINAIYQTEDIWVMYNFFKSDQYEEGINVQFKGHLRNFFGGRPLIYYFGHLRSFKVSLMRKVPLKQHLDQTGKFLDTLYDTAFQYPLFQFSGEQHGKFVKQTNLLYTKQHGNNDDSTTYKSIRRAIKHFFISLRRPYGQLPQLDDKEDQEVKQIFQREKGIDFIQVK